jgi:hypothetical protein
MSCEATKQERFQQALMLPDGEKLCCCCCCCCCCCQDWSAAVQLLLEACSKLATEELAKVGLQIHVWNAELQRKSAVLSAACHDCSTVSKPVGKSSSKT